MSLARRGFLKFFGGAAVAGPAVARNAVNHAMASQQAGALANAVSAYQTPVAAPEEPPVIRELRELGWRRNEDAQRLIAYRDGHFDSDIACLHSLPHATKVRMQKARDDAWTKETRSIFDRLRDLENGIAGRIGGTMAQAAVSVSRRILG
jgi:hypothetical protein